MISRPVDDGIKNTGFCRLKIATALSEGRSKHKLGNVRD